MYATTMIGMALPNPINFYCKIWVQMVDMTIGTAVCLCICNAIQCVVGKPPAKCIFAGG
jgi:hypothetical protein